MKQQNKKVPVKNIITTYEKKFDSFIKMIKELRSLDDGITEILCTDTTEVEEKANIDQTYCSARDAYDYFANIFPDIISHRNMHTSLTISSNRVTIKTDKYFTIGWKFKYDKDQNITDISAIVTTFTRPDIKSNLNEKLQSEESWTVVER